MNIVEGSTNKWLSTASYSNNSQDAGGDGNGSSITFHNNNGQGSSNPHLWDIRWFPLLSGPLLLGTIIAPLVTGPTIRYLCYSYLMHRGSRVIDWINGGLVLLWFILSGLSVKFQYSEMSGILIIIGVLIFFYYCLWGVYYMRRYQGGLLIYGFSRPGFLG